MSIRVVQNTIVVISVLATTWLGWFGIPFDRHREAFTFWQRGRAYLLAGRLDDAHSCLRQAVSLDAANSEAQADLGRLLLKTGRVDQARTVLEAAAAELPERADVLTNLGNAYARLGERVRAEQCYRRAVGIEPNLSLAWLNLGRLLESEGRPKEAIDAYKNAAAVQPRASAESLVRLGSVYLDMGFVSDAKAAFSRAIDQDPKSEHGLVGLAKCLEQEREFSTAASLYKRATEQKLADAYGWVGLARVQATVGETQEAVATLRTSLRLLPDNPRLLSELALLLIKNAGAAQEAEYLARKATEVAPEIAPTHETLGDVLKGLHKQSATESYRRAFDLYSTSQQTASAQRVKAKLDSLTEKR